MKFVENIWLLAAIVVSGLVERGHFSRDLKDSVSKDNDNKVREAALNQTGKRPATIQVEREPPETAYIYGRCSVRPDPASHGTADHVGGTVHLRQPLRGGPTEIRLSLRGFSQSDRRRRHGVRVHQYGAVADDCRAAGGLYDPFGVSHDSATDTSQFKHFGDLGSIEESRDGTVGHVMKDYALSLLGPFSILGRAVVIHLGGDVDRTPTNSGERLACCTISLSNGSGWR